MSDDLFMLPTDETGEPSEGGAVDDISIFTKDALKKRLESDKKFDLQAVPIVLVSKDIGVTEKPTIQAFMEAGLTLDDILGVNGPLVERILKDRTIATDELLQHIVMNTDAISYKNISDLLGEQVSFIILFHHLFFLATLSNDSFDATFRDSLEDRFTTLARDIEMSKSKRNTQPVSVVFGQPRSVVVAFWDRLQKDYVTNEKNRRTYADVEGFIISGADRVLQYLIKSQVEIQAGVPNNLTATPYETMETGFEPGPTAEAKETKNNVSNTASTAETHGEDEEEKEEEEEEEEKKEEKIPPANIVENNASATNDPENSSKSTSRKSSANKVISQQSTGKTNITRHGKRYRPGLPSVNESENLNNTGSVAVKSRRSRKLNRRR